MNRLKIEDPKAPGDAEQQRAEQFARKQKWKELPGNRYTAEELRQMAASLGPLRITEQEVQVMHLD